MARWCSWLLVPLVFGCAEEPVGSEGGAAPAVEAGPESEDAGDPRPVPTRAAEPAPPAPADDATDPVLQTQPLEVDVEVPADARGRMTEAGREALERLARQRGYEGVKSVKLIKPSCTEKCRVKVTGEAWRQVKPAEPEGTDAPE
jgi:hypothetical protein